MKYSEAELADAIDALIEEIKKRVPNSLSTIEANHPVVKEIDMFGPDGPCGIGLGQFGGHAVGDETRTE